MNTANSIERPAISENALSMFRYIFYSRVFMLEQQSSSTTYAQQSKIYRLRFVINKFINSRPYAFFKIVILPENGADIGNPEYSLTIKNFDYYVKSLEPHNYVIVITPTWDTFSVFEETIDKNLIPVRL